MTARSCLLFVVVASTLVQAQSEDPHAVVNGKTVALSDLASFAGSIPPQYRTNAEAIFQAYGFTDRLAERAEAAKLAERSPYKEQLELVRKQILAQAMLTELTSNVQIPEEEMKAYYEKHAAEFSIASVQTLRVPRLPQQDPADALAKARQLVPQLNQGTNLPALLAQYPAGLPSVGKGDPTVPPDFRNAVFALKPGEVPAPVVEPNGVYRFGWIA